MCVCVRYFDAVGSSYSYEPTAPELLLVRLATPLYVAPWYSACVCTEIMYEYEIDVYAKRRTGFAPRWPTHSLNFILKQRQPFIIPT